MVAVTGEPTAAVVPGLSAVMVRPVEAEDVAAADALRTSKRCVTVADWLLALTCRVSVCNPSSVPFGVQVKCPEESMLVLLMVESGWVSESV